MSELTPLESTMHSSRSNSHLSPAVSSDKRNKMDSSKAPFASPPAQNVAFAVNYSLPSVDQFVAPAGRAKSNNKSSGDFKAAPSTPTSQSDTMPQPQRAQLVEKDMNRGKTVTIVDTASLSTPATKRSSRRHRKPREKSREKQRVRYDMNHVPVVQRHHQFVAHHRSQDAAVHHRHKQRALPPRRTSTRTSKDHEQETINDDTCHKCKGEELPAPFVADSSVVWIPTKRTEWEDCLSEMTAVCTSAALRRHVASKATSTSKPFFAPLSQDYIRDRIDIDDPLEGYQIRHKAGGWLQGFIIWTNFTTWTHYFKWDSLHEMSGVQSSRKVDKTCHVDADGSLSAELEAQPRSGDPLATGVVFPTIAEIGLLGGIGCGEYLLRMALDEIKSRGQYKYVVLQATDASMTFYERFGFVRVGAVCRYGMNGTQQTGSAVPEGQQPQEAKETDLVGYRHWTYANERNLDTYGGPSYMMALRLPSDDSTAVAAPECPNCSSEVQKPTVIEQLKAVAVEEKPKITQLGAAPTPFKKSSPAPFKKSSLASVAKPVPIATMASPYPPGVKRRGRPPKYWSDMRRSSNSPQQTEVKNHSNPPASKHQPRSGMKKRGRPSKSGSFGLQQPAEKCGPERRPKSSFAMHQEPEVKCGPGRPRKTPGPKQATVKHGPSHPSKLSLDKPPATPPSSDEPKAKRRRTSTENFGGLDIQREVLMAPPAEGEKLSFSQKQYQDVWLAVPPKKSNSGGRRPPREREVYMGNLEFFRKKKRNVPEGGNDAPPKTVTSPDPLPAAKQKKDEVVNRRSSRLMRNPSHTST